MNKAYSLIAGCTFLIASTTANLSTAQDSYVEKDLAIDSGVSSFESNDSSSWSGVFEAGTRRTVTYNGVEFAFCYCPAGAFTMGSPVSEEERFDGETPHEVTLTKGFWIQETETTQAQWDALGIPKEGECFFKGKDLPVDTVSWNECDAFVSKLNELGIAPKGLKFALPTEAQWEYACRAGTKTPFFWGNSLNGDKANCEGNYPYGTETTGNYLGTTCPAKRYGANPWGVCDMHGNVYEWCADWYGDYPSESVVDPDGPADGLYRVIRGGSWYDLAVCCRSADRYNSAPESLLDDVGFRLALTSDDAEK